MSQDSRRSALAEEIKLCQSCGLCKNMPFKPIPGVGPSDARLMIVGEAPGEDESIMEEPFVGQCGRLLDRLLKEAGLERDQIYICNTVNCRPVEGKKNRTPTQVEINQCKHWLYKQIGIVKPQVIFTLGKIPTRTILHLKSSFTLKDYIGIPHNTKFDLMYNFEEENPPLFHFANVIPNYHPSYLMQYGKKELELAVNIFKKGLEHA